MSVWPIRGEGIACQTRNAAGVGHRTNDQSPYKVRDCKLKNEHCKMSINPDFQSDYFAICNVHFAILILVESELRRLAPLRRCASRFALFNRCVHSGDNHRSLRDSSRCRNHWDTVELHPSACRLHSPSADDEVSSLLRRCERRPCEAAPRSAVASLAVASSRSSRPAQRQHRHRDHPTLAISLGSSQRLFRLRTTRPSEHLCHRR